MTILMKGKQFTVLAALFALVIGAGAAFYAWRAPAIGAVPPAVWQDFAAQFSGAEAFKPAHDLPIDLKMKDLRDQPVAWETLRGRVTLVNFWALWCPPCLKELPSLKALEDARAGAEFDVVYISMDYPEDAAQLTDVMKFRGVPEIDTLYVGDLESWNALKLKALPTTLILDRKGRVAYRLLGDIDWTGPGAQPFLDAILAE
ncbi:MAG: TlpA family protein disulfide reductase [Alphaproteobacteria bacterium]|nr:TlpA family protein disulfide reductase [Alphaproteobacteria bacterium]